MTAHLRHITVATLLAAAGMAHAASVVVPAGTGVYNGLTFHGLGSLSFSADLLGALDTGKVKVEGYGVATPTITKDSDGFYTEVSVTAPFTSMTIDTATNNVVAVSTTGGATQTASALKSVSSGGSLTVTDLNVDLVNKKVYATLIGGNGVGTLNNFYLWDIGAITGTTSVSSGGTYTTTLSGLSITTEGFNKFVQSLGLLNLGRSALLGVTDFGVITSYVSSGMDDGPHLPPITPEFPEPSSYAMMGLGLAGMLMARRRVVAHAKTRSR